MNKYKGQISHKHTEQIVKNGNTHLILQNSEGRQKHPHRGKRHGV